MSWTPERVEALKKGFYAGDSFSQIARRVGGVSRNACIGKALRLGLERSQDKELFNRVAARIGTAKARAKAVLKAPAVARAPAQNNGYNFGPPRPPMPPRPEGLRAVALFAAPAEGGVAMSEVCRGHCRWPFGAPEGAAFRFCGKPRAKGPYCTDHAGRAFNGNAAPFDVEGLMRGLR